MRRPRIDQRQPPFANRDRHALLEGDIGGHHAGVAIDPRKQRSAALIETLVRSLVGRMFIVLVFARAFLSDNDG